VLGLLIGTVLGSLSAAGDGVFSPLMQTLADAAAAAEPGHSGVSALAPLLVLWFGFGMASKVVMAVLVIFFPVTAAFSDGLRRNRTGMARPGAHDERLAQRHPGPCATARGAASFRLRASPWATAIAADSGAVVGEWVGASAGLGYVMLNANARIQTDVMFAALFVLAMMAILLWGTGRGIAC